MKRVTETYPDLKAWREAKGITQVAAAAFLGISTPHYCKMERRQNSTTGKRAKIITAKTGVPIDVLVGAA